MEKFNIVVYFTDEECKEKFIKLCKRNNPNAYLGCVDGAPLSYETKEYSFVFTQYPYSSNCEIKEKHVEAFLFVSSYDYFLEDEDINKTLMKFKDLNIEHFLFINDFDHYTSDEDELNEYINQLEEQKISLNEIMGLKWKPYVKTLFMKEELEGKSIWTTKLDDFFLGVKEYMHKGIPTFAEICAINQISLTSYKMVARVKQGQLYKTEDLYLYYQGEMIGCNVKLMLTSSYMPTLKARKGHEAKMHIELKKPVNLTKDHILITKDALVKGKVLNILTHIPTQEEWGERYQIKTDDVLTFFIQDKPYMGKVSFGMGKNEIEAYYNVCPGEEKLITVVFKEDVEVVLGQSLQIGLYETNPYLDGKIIAFGKITEVFEEHKPMDISSCDIDYSLEDDFN